MLATEELIAEARQGNGLAAALEQYCRDVPLYRQAARGRERDGGNPAPERLSQMPLLTKQDIRRDFPENFLGPGADLEGLLEGELELEHTSGTSEERTPLLLPRGWWAEQERKALRLNPLVESVLKENPEARRATINSPVCSSEVCFTGVPSRQERVVGNTLFVSLSRHPFLCGETELARMAAEVAEWQPQFLDIDPVYGVVFGLYCERRGIRLPSLRFVLASYEFVSVVHRRILERVLKVPVFNLYGSTETGHLLMEDEGGQMRPSVETAFLEVIEPDARGIGELIVTTLSNDVMPLIRYRIGDLVERRPEPYGTAYVVHGRVADAFARPDGARVTTREIDQCFTGIGGIAHYQLLERVDRPWLLRVAPDVAGPAPEELSTLRARLGERLALREPVIVQATDALLPEGSGKFRLGYPAAESSAEA